MSANTQLGLSKDGTPCYELTNMGRAFARTLNGVVGEVLSDASP